MKCMKCGKEMRNTKGGNYVCDDCGFTVNPGIGDNPNYDFVAPQGWICPKCGAVLSPSTIFCPFCVPNNNKSTITNDRITYNVDYTHHDSTTGINSGQYTNPNINTIISGGKK